MGLLDKIRQALTGSEDQEDYFEMCWSTKGAGTYHEKIAFEPHNQFLVTQKRTYTEVHIFNTKGLLVRIISLEELFHSIKKQNEEYIAGTKRFAYVPDCFGLDKEGVIYIGGRHDHLYVLSCQGDPKGEVLLHSEEWQEDIEVDNQGQIYILYQSGGIIVANTKGQLICRIPHLGVHNCRRLAVNSKREIYVAGASNATYGWANCIRKISSKGLPQRSVSSFTNIGHIAIDAHDNLYVIEMNDGVLIKLDSKLDEIERLRLYYQDKRKKTGLSYAQSIALDGDGNCYILERNMILKFRLPF